MSTYYGLTPSPRLYNFADQSSASLISITSCNSTAAPGAGHYAAAGTMSSPGMVMEQSGHIRRESGYYRHKRLDYDFSTNNDDFSTMKFSTIF